MFNFQSQSDSMIRSAGFTLVNQNGVKYPMIRDNSTDQDNFFCPSDARPNSGDVLSLVNSEFYLVLECYQKPKQSTTVVTTRLTWTADFKRFSATTKNEFGRDTAGYETYLEDKYLYFRGTDNDQLEALIPKNYGVLLQDIVCIDGDSYRISSIYKDGGGVWRLLLTESDSI